MTKTKCRNKLVAEIATVVHDTKF